MTDLQSSFGKFVWWGRIVTVKHAMFLNVTNSLSEGGKNVQQRLPCIMQTSNEFAILVRESGNILTDCSFLLRGTGLGWKTNRFGTLSNFERAKVAGRFNLLRVHDRPVQMSMTARYRCRTDFDCCCCCCRWGASSRTWNLFKTCAGLWLQTGW